MHGEATPQPERPPVPRRNFLNAFLAAAWSALMVSVVYPILRYLSPPRVPEHTAQRVLAGKVSELESQPWKIFPFGSEPAILIKVDNGELRAFSAVCTHLACIVQYEQASKRIWCACHNGWYDLSGRNIAGPPPRPLTRYEVHIVGDDIFVSRA